MSADLGGRRMGFTLSRKGDRVEDCDARAQ